VQPDAALSLWRATAPPTTLRPALDADTHADVAVVGGGFTGLWTAYHLSRAGRRVVVVEQGEVGFGASGRNGGWCSALWPKSWSAVAARHGEQAARDLGAACRGSVDAVLGTVADEGIDAQAAKGGTVVLARTGVQLARARAHAAEAAHWGDRVELLDAAEASARLAATGVLGGTWTPDCAALHPLRLVRGLAEATERHGATIYERTRATGIEPGLVRTTGGSVRAPVVIRATEGFTARLPRHRRVLAPVYSLMVATEPLDAATWGSIGLASRETFSDYRHLIIYGQRTADGRLAFGGRGAPYHFGSAIRPGFDRDERTHRSLTRVLAELFPALAGTPISYRWGGPLGIARDWAPSVGLDPATGIGWAGGYVGDGVAAANLAGRTLADLVLGRDTPLCRLPWVGHRSPRWEPEPLRWLGVNAGLAAMTAADAEERATRRPSLLAAGFGTLTGH
jgi:glycine/D-amino acid oxidase-like deaminating enzyme